MFTFQIVLLGNADEVVQYLVHKLNWDLPELPQCKPDSLTPDRPRTRKRSSEDIETRSPRRVGDRYANPAIFLFDKQYSGLYSSHVWLFEGAEGGRWVSDLEQQYTQSAQASGAHAQVTSDEGRSKMKKPRVS